MVDPQFVTKFDRTQRELEEFAMFSVCVAGKDATNTAKAVDRLCQKMLSEIIDFYVVGNSCQCFYPPTYPPLRELYSYVSIFSISKLQELMQKCGIGCHTGIPGMIPGKAEICFELANKLIQNYDFLRVCTVEDLENIKGIGAKTARFFIMHSRPNQRIAVLDTHILHWLRDQGVAAPKTTPSKGSKKYKDLELTFLTLADKLGEDPAILDLRIWNEYSRNGLGKTGTTCETV